MSKFITVNKAKQEIKRLQEYINLVENYEAETLEKMIIKEYAISNSMVEVIKKMNADGYTVNGEEINRDYVVSIINSSKTSDELHRLVRLGYRAKVRSSRSKYLNI